MEKLIAFHGDEKIKAKYIKRLKAHAKADEFVQGIYWENGKGCAVGCTIHGNEHSRYETELGIPRILAQLEDKIFEGMSNKDAKEFPLQFLESVPVGADLSLVFFQFMHWMLVDKEEGVVKFANTEGAKAIKKVATLMKKKVDGKAVSDKAWKAATAAAHATAARAARAATDAATYATYAARAAYAATYAARAAYADIAACAADYAAYVYGNDRELYFKKMGNKLCELMRNAPITNNTTE